MRKKEVIYNFEVGKIPPQATDLEEAVLGCLMIGGDSIEDAIEILTPLMFYKTNNQLIYESIYDLYSKNEIIDILSVVTDLKKKGNLESVGGAYYISQLTNKVSSSSNVEFYSRIIQQKYISRELIRISSETIKKSYDDTTDVFDNIDSLNKSITDIENGLIVEQIKTTKELFKENLDHLEKINTSKNGLTGVLSGFIDLDRITGGFQETDFIILAARPSMGKSALALQFAYNPALRNNEAILFFSLEMGSAQLFSRLQSLHNEIPFTKIYRTGCNLEEMKTINKNGQSLIKMPLFIDDTSLIPITKIRSIARKYDRQIKAERKTDKGLSMIVIDYLQLVSAQNPKINSNREQDISFVSRSLKALAKELKIPVIALSQLGREVEKRADKRPQLSDLRESGAIEQDADMVIFVFRPEYYKITEDENGQPLEKGYTEIDIAKNRNGELDTIKLKFVGDLMKFYDMNTDNFDIKQSIKPNINFYEPKTENESDTPF